MKISSEPKVNEPAFSKLKSYFSLVKMFSSYKLAVKAFRLRHFSLYKGFLGMFYFTDREGSVYIYLLSLCSADGHRCSSRLEVPKAWLYGEKHCMH